jgi:hypothetical protein
VFGLSTVPNASGVFGANNNGGVGVSGNSDNGSGMVAMTKSSANQGIFAANNSTDPAPKDKNGQGVGGNGVFGLSTVPNAAGVLGANNSLVTGGMGIAGISNNGYGVYGIGKIAGHFEGNVEVTDGLLLGGGVSSNGGGLKHLRVPVSVPFGGGFFQIDWPSPFPDANYTVVGSVEDLQINFGIQLQFVNLSLKTASSVNVFISNANETSKNAVINLVAMHD